MTQRNRGPRWSSPKQADRGRPIRGFSLPPELHRALDALAEQKVNLSALAEEALRAHPKVAAELAASGPGSGPCPSDECPFARCTDSTHWTK